MGVDKLIVSFVKYRAIRAIIVSKFTNEATLRIYYLPTNDKLVMLESVVHLFY